MTDVFLKVLNISYGAAWVVLAVVIARLVLKKAPRSLVCALWALVAVRLIFGGIEAPFSMIPSPEIIPPESLFDQSPQLHTGVSIVDSIVNPVYTDSLRPQPGASVNPLQIWLAVFANIWLLGMAAMAGWAAFSWLRVRRQVRESIREGDVYLCDRISSPFIFGLVRPKIYLPSDLEEGSRDHVIAHERAHLSRRDHWWKPLGFALLTVNWFNPMLWLAYLLLCRDIEMACDEKVVRQLSLEAKKAYSAALLGCSVNGRRITACPLAFGEVGVKQRIKSVLHYKKPAFWMILISLILMLVLALGLLTDPPGKTCELWYGGHLYVQTGTLDSYLPSAEPVGTLRSILHSTREHPTEELQATNLEESLAGCPLYPDGNNLYLHQFDGSCIVFELQTPEALLSEYLGDRSRTLHLNLHAGQLSADRELTGPAATELADLIREALDQPMAAAPTPDWSVYAADSDVWITISRDSGSGCFQLIRSLRYGWVCAERGGELGDRVWFFDGSNLDSFLTAYEAEHHRLNGCYPLTGDNSSLLISFRTIESDGILFQAAFPDMDVGSPPVQWHWEALTEGTGFRARPAGKEDWMEVRYYDTEETLYYYFHGIQDSPITLSSGITGTLYHSGDQARWSMIALNTTRGQIQITGPDIVYNSTDWTAEDYQMARAIVESLTVTKNGESLLAAVKNDGNPLGITLSARDVTGHSLRLFYAQEGGSEGIAEIITSPDWTLDRWEDGQWVSIRASDSTVTGYRYPVLMGGTTAWTVEVFSAQEGRYRIGKTFWGHPEPDDTKSTTQVIEQTCYAEFWMNPLGITLEVTNVTRNGCTLVCTQDGTPWESITTGAQWNIQKYEDGQWVSIMPETTVWTTIAYGVNQGQTTSWNLNWSLIVGSLEPGRYQVSKNFIGERGSLYTPGVEKETVQQTCRAEFTIE